MSARGIFVAVLFLSGCSIPSGYVTADRMTYDAIAPEYRAYVAADSARDRKARARRIRLVEAWEARLLEAERGADDE